mgnify:CR=1 FL=1
MPAPKIPVFDGHNDFLLRLRGDPAKRRTIWLEGDGIGHLDLPRMRRGGLAGGMFAIYVPSPRAGGIAGQVDRDMDNPPYDVPLPAALDQTEALTMVCAQVFGNQAATTFAGSQGNFELNVFKPVMIRNLLHSSRLLADGMKSFEKNLVAGLEADEKRISSIMSER